MFSYQKIKNRIDELEERVRYELSIRKKKPTQAEMPSSGSHKVFFQKLKLSKLNLLFLSLRLLFWELMLNLVQFFILVFGDTANSFDILFKQKSLTVCNYSYSQFKKLQQRVKVFSVAGLTTIIAVTVITSLLINLATGPVMQIFAAQYDFVQQSWSGGVISDELSCNTAGGTWSSGVCVATHTNNKTGWTNYASKDAGVTAGGDLTVTATSDSFEESTSGFDSNTSADSSLSVTASSVALLKPDTAACSADAECENNCQGGVCSSVPTKILVYVTTASHNGDFDSGSGARAGLDAFCEANGKPAGAQNVHAMVSVSASDEVRDMWSNYGYDDSWSIYWYNLSTQTKILLADNKTDMLSSGADNSQYIGTGNNNDVWGGGDGYGGLYAKNCSDWTSSSYTNNPFNHNDSARYGAADRTGAFYWLSEFWYSCSETHYIRCMFTW